MSVNTDEEINQVKGSCALCQCTVCSDDRGYIAINDGEILFCSTACYEEATGMEMLEGTNDNTGHFYICPYCNEMNGVNDGGSCTLENGTIMMSCGYCGKESIFDHITDGAGNFTKREPESRLEKLRKILNNRFPEGYEYSFGEPGYEECEEQDYLGLIEDIEEEECKNNPPMSNEEAEEFNRRRFEAGLSPWIMNYPDVYCYRGEEVAFYGDDNLSRPYNLCKFVAFDWDNARERITHCTSENVFDRMLPAQESLIPAHLTKCTSGFFSIDGGKTYLGYTAGQNWNGWACPYFTIDVAKQITDGASDDSLRIRYDEERDSFFFFYTDEEEYEKEHGEIYEPYTCTGMDIMSNGEIVHVYDIGNGAWCWDEIEVHEKIYCAFCGDVIEDGANYYEGKDPKTGEPQEFCDRTCAGGYLIPRLCESKTYHREERV